jgi:hypothetical protein
MCYGPWMKLKLKKKNSYVDEGEEVLSHRNSDTTPN